MRAAPTRPAPQQLQAPLATAPAWLLLAIEALWLAAVFLVIVAFDPPDSSMATHAPYRIIKLTVLRVLVAFMVGLWLIDLAYALRGRVSTDPALWWQRAKAWVRERPQHWTVVAALGFLLVNVVATHWSFSRQVSLWGKFPGDEGYSLVNTAAYVFLFLVIATHVRTRAQVWRLVTAMVAGATVMSAYGVLQYLGLDPLGLVDAGRRITSTIGNPIFVGAVLVMTIPLTLARCVLSVRLSWRAWEFAVWSAALVLQLAALALTLSRGPWVGALVAMAVFGVLGVLVAWRTDTGSVLTRTVRLSGALALCVAIGLVAQVQLRDTAVLEQVGARGETILEVFEGTGGLRLAYWQEAVRMSLERPTPQGFSDGLAWARHVLGYGPETFPFIYMSQEAPDVPGVAWNERLYYAHNHLVHEFLELGLLGIAAYVALIGTAIWAAAGSLLGRRTAPRERLWLEAAILAAILGKLVEAVPGIPRVADLTVFWALLALLVALPRVYAPATLTPDSSPLTPHRRARHRTRRPSAQPIVLPKGLVVAVLAGVVLVGVSLAQNVSWYRASHFAGQSTIAAAAGDGAEALRLVDRAIAVSPGSGEYHRLRSVYLRISADSVTDRERRMEFLEQAYASGVRAVERAPLHLDSAQAAATAAVRLLNEGRADMAEDAVRLTQRVVNLRAGEVEPYEQLAAVLVQAGDPERAVETARLALELFPDSRRAAQLHLLLAIALLDLDDRDTALEHAQLSLDLGGLSNDEQQSAREILGEA